MRSLRLLLLFLPTLLIGFSSCCEEDPFGPTRINRHFPQVERSRAAYVRVIHAAATGPGVIVLYDSVPVFRRVAQSYFRFQTEVNEAHYYPVDTATQRIEFRTEGGTVLASLDPLSLEVGQYYTLYFHGREGAYGVFRTRDRPMPLPGVDATRLRVIILRPILPL